MKSHLKAAAVQSAIEAYFADCDRPRAEDGQKAAKNVCRTTPYTLAGLAAATGIDRDRIKELSRESEASKVGRLFRDALRRIERYTVEGALIGELQLSIAQMLLSDMGYGVKSPDAAGESLVITMDDPGRWGE